MQSKTKIIVLHQKKLVITAIILLAIILLAIICLLVSKAQSESVNAKEPCISENVENNYVSSLDSGTQEALFHPGVYTSSFTIDSTDYSVIVTLDSSNINNIELINNNEIVETSNSTIQSTFDEIKNAIITSQSLHSFNIDSTNRYTNNAILSAIEASIKKASLK